jgi:hypothetical protein
MLKYFVAILVLSASAMPALADGVAPLVGGDRDAHGCIPSAGYLWCEHTNTCERPWELAQSKGFNNDENGFTSFCQPHQSVKSSG